MQRLIALQLCCLWYAAAARESRSLVTSAQSNGPGEDFLLWDLKVSSLRACALACTVDDKCSFFSFWKKNSLEGGPLCRGHSQQPTSTSKQPVSAPDAVTFQVSKFWVSEESQGYSGNTDSTQRTAYMSGDNSRNTGGAVDLSSPCSPIQSTQADVGTDSPTLEELATGGSQEETATVLDWVNTRCRDSADCTMANSDCFSSRCLCSIGYYYSNSMNTCLRGCAATNLTDSFTRYPFYYIDGYHNKTMLSDTPGSCRESCAAEAWCRSFDYEVSTRSVCKLRSMTALDVPSTDLRFSMRIYVSHYQRQCN